MRAHTPLVIIPLLLATATTGAQSNGNGQSSAATTSSIFDALLHSSWSLFLDAGAGSNGRFLLQRVTGTSGERTIKANDAFNAGVGVGLDFLPRTGARLSYTFNTSDLVFRSDNGDGSENFDVDDGGTLQNHVVAAEVLRYMFPARSVVTPYASGGFVAAWWNLDGQSSIAVAGESSTQFRWGAMGTFGVQFQLSDHTSTRIEVARSSIRNPFTGSESYFVPGGVTIDEPTRVSQTDFRFVAAFYFSGPSDPKVLTAKR